jgi:uncharacterized BrkB/YihY/UPF0761 family membrane protein
MALYWRLLRYIRPYLALSVGGFLATIAFTALDAFSFVMLLHFLETLFQGGASATVDFSGDGSRTRCCATQWGG